MKQGNVSLRTPEPEDLEVMLSFENDAALWELGTATGPYSRYQMKRYIAESQNDLYADGQLRLMIVIYFLSLYLINEVMPFVFF